MITDLFLKKAIANITLNTSTSAEYCFNIPLIDFIDFYNILCEVTEEIRREADK